MFLENYFDNKKKFLIFISILVFLCYFNALFMDFVWDDIVHLEEFEHRLKNFSDLKNFFFSTNLVGQPFYYRPLMLISYGLDYLIYGNKSFGYHLTSILIHLINVYLVFIITERMLNKDIAFLSSLLFAIHPVNSEAVVWISARADVLSALFAFSSILFYLKTFEKNCLKNYILTVLFFIFAIFTKETFLILIILFVFFPLFKNVVINTKWIFFNIINFLLVVLYFFIRINVVERFLGDYFPLEAKIATIPLIILSYFKLFFYPVDLKILYDYPKILFKPNFYSLVGWIALLMIFSLIVVLYKKNKLLSFFLFFYFLFILPVSGIITFIRVSLIADRYLYFPSFGLIVFCSYLLSKIHNLTTRESIKKFIIKLYFLTFFLLFVLTVIRNFTWSNQYDFLQKMIKDKPDYHGAYIHMAHYYFGKKRLNEAEKALLEALKYVGVGDEHVVYNNLCVLYRVKQEYDKAEEYCLKTIYFNKEYALGYYNLSLLYFETEKFDYAYHYILEALKYDKKNTPDFYNLAGIISFKLGQYDEALKFVDKAIELNPEKKEYKINKNMILNTLN